MLQMTTDLSRFNRVAMQNALAPPCALTQTLSAPCLADAPECLPVSLLFLSAGSGRSRHPATGAVFIMPLGHLLQGTEAMADLECGGAIDAMVLREYIANCIEQSASACCIMLRALRWRVHDTSQQGAMGKYNSEDMCDTRTDDADVRQMHTPAELAYQSGEVEALDVAEPAIMAALATCVRNGAWGSELECAELNEWLNMYDIELRCVSSE